MITFQTSTWAINLANFPIFAEVFAKKYRSIFEGAW